MKKIEIEEKWNPFFKKIFAIIKQDGFICGGFVRTILTKAKNDTVADIDIYCINDEAYDRIKERLEEDGYVIEKETPMSILYKVLFKGRFPIQLIKPMDKGHVTTVGELEDILKNFDFTCIRAGIYLNIEKLESGEEIEKYIALVDDDFEEDNKKKILRIKNIHCPIAEIFRVAKYVGKGFYLPAMEAIHILTDWEGRNDDYKIKLLDFLKKENPSKEDIDVLETMLHID
jgi:hypothetical protein